MQIDNFFKNIDLIQKGRAYNWSYFLIESDIMLNSFKSDFHEIFEINDLDLSIFKTKSGQHGIYPMNENIYKSLNFEELKKKIQGYGAISNIYLLRIKIVQMIIPNQKDLNFISVISVPTICENVLSILSLTYRHNYFRQINISLAFSCDYSQLPEIKLEDAHFKTILSWMIELSENQFLLVMDSVRFFNLAKIMSHTDVAYAYSMLCSSIETFSQTFPIPKNFSNHNIGKMLKKDMKKEGIMDEKITGVMNTFGKKYEIRYMHQTTKNFIEYCLKFLGKGHISKISIIFSEDTQKMMKHMISEWYKFRSKITHGHLKGSYSIKRNLRITKNEIKSNGNLKEIESQANQTIKIPKSNEILPFNNMINIVAIIIELTIQDFISKKEDKENLKQLEKRNLYHIGEPLRVILKKDRIKPSGLVRIGQDTYKDYTITDHFHNLLLLGKVYDNLKKKKFQEVIKLFKNIINLSEMTDKTMYEYFRSYLQICGKETKKYQALVDFFNKSELTLDSKRYELLNDKALFLGKLKRFQEAHNIIDSIIKKDKNKPQQLILYYDTKGDIYFLETKEVQAKAMWEKSLTFGISDYNKETKEKLKLLSENKEEILKIIL